MLERFGRSSLRYLYFSKPCHFEGQRKKSKLTNHTNDVEDERLLVEHKKSPLSIMVSAAALKMGKTPLHFIKPGVKVNREYFRKNLIRKLIPEMKLAGGPGEFYIFMQDGARPHTADETVEYLKEKVPQLLEPQQWPRNSPELNMVDFSIWSILEQNVFRGRPPITTLD